MRPGYEEWLASYVPMRGADGEADGAATETAPAEAAAAAVDFSPVNERMDQLGAQMQELMTRVPQAQQEAEADPEFDFSSYDETDPVAAQRLLDDFINHRLEQATKPLVERIDQLQAGATELSHGLDAKDLESRYPALKEPAVAESVVGQAAGLAQQIGRPEAALHPALLELTYLAQMGRERASAERAAGGQVEAGLEDASGGTPGGADAPSLADQIRASRGQQNSVFGFATGG